MVVLGEYRYLNDEYDLDDVVLVVGGNVGYLATGLKENERKNHYKNFIEFGEDVNEEEIQEYWDLSPNEIDEIYETTKLKIDNKTYKVINWEEVKTIRESDIYKDIKKEEEQQEKDKAYDSRNSLFI